jgi:uncharacterized glyoxalase superfamily protein PhnB
LLSPPPDDRTHIHHDGIRRIVAQAVRPTFTLAGDLHRQRRALQTVRSSLSTHDLLRLLEVMNIPDGTIEKHISILVYADLHAAFHHLIDVFGLGPGEMTFDADDHAVHAELEAGNAVVWLHPESTDFGLASPRTVGTSTAMVAVMVDDVDAHHQRTVERGGTVDYPRDCQIRGVTGLA